MPGLHDERTGGAVIATELRDVAARQRTAHVLRRFTVPDLGQGRRRQVTIRIAVIGTGEDLARVLLNEEKTPRDEAWRLDSRFREAANGAVAIRVPLQEALDPELIRQSRRRLAHPEKLRVGKHLILVNEL